MVELGYNLKLEHSTMVFPLQKLHYSREISEEFRCKPDCIEGQL